MKQTHLFKLASYSRWY